METNYNDKDLRIIMHDIRNYKTLSRKQLDFIETLNNEENFKIIQLQNEMFEHFNQIIENL
jgi:hypothetical protein